MIVRNDHLYPSALLTGSRAVQQSSWGHAAFQTFVEGSYDIDLWKETRPEPNAAKT